MFHSAIFNSNAMVVGDHFHPLHAATSTKHSSIKIHAQCSKRMRMYTCVTHRNINNKTQDGMHRDATIQHRTRTRTEKTPREVYALKFMSGKAQVPRYPSANQ